MTSDPCVQGQHILDSVPIAIHRMGRHVHPYQGCVEFRRYVCLDTFLIMSVIPVVSITEIDIIVGVKIHVLSTDEILDVRVIFYIVFSIGVDILQHITEILVVSLYVNYVSHIPKIITHEIKLGNKIPTDSSYISMTKDVKYDIRLLLQQNQTSPLHILHKGGW